MNEISIHVNFRSRESIGEQLVSELRRLVEQGEFGAGAQLPPVRELAEKLNVNFNTVARAYRQLDQLGLISTRQGRGSFVLEKENPTAPPGQCAIEVFLDRLDAFLTLEARNCGKTSGALLSLALERRAPAPPSARARGKSGKKKFSRKPGRVPGSILFGFRGQASRPRRRKRSRRNTGL